MKIRKNHVWTQEGTVENAFCEQRWPEEELNGLKKAVLLVRYVNLLRHWIVDTAKRKGNDSSATVNDINGIPPFPAMSKWEQLNINNLPRTTQSVSSHYKTIFHLFHEHFQFVQQTLKDDSLDNKKKHLQTIAQF